MIGTFISLGALLLDVSKWAFPESKEIDAASKVANKAAYSYNVLNTTSASQRANRAVIAPMVAIDQTILHQDYMNDLMQVVMLRDEVATLTNIAMNNADAMGVKIENILGGVLPKRSGLEALMGCESALTTARGYVDSHKPKQVTKDEDLRDTVSINGKSMPDFKEYTPLAVGRVVLATVYGKEGGRLDFPLTFRQIPVPVSNKDLKLIFSASKAEDGLSARFLMAKSGEITTPELLTGSDIVKEKFRIRNQEMSGYYKEATKRETVNRIASIRTGVISMNSMANTFILSRATADQLELEIGRTFKRASTRDQIFKAVKANTIVIADDGAGVFTFYTNGVDLPETYTRREISVKAAKESGANTLTDLVKLLNGGL